MSKRLRITLTRKAVVAVSALLGLVVIAGGVSAIALLDGLPAKATELRDSGIRAAERAAHVEAIERLAECLAEDPNDPTALYHYGLARRHVLATDGEHLRNALQAFKQCCVFAPQHVEAWREQAAALLAIGDAEKAVYAARRAHRLADDESSVAMLITCLFRAGHDAEADELVESALGTYPGSLSLHCLQLTMLAARGGRDAVLSAVQSRADDGRLQLAVAHGFLLAGDPRSAVESLGRVPLRIPQELEPAELRPLITALESAGRPDVGLWLLEQNGRCLSDPALRLRAARASWDLGWHDWIVPRVPRHELDLACNPETAFLYLASLCAADRRDEATAILDELETPTAASVMWGGLCRLGVDIAADPARTVEATADVLRVSPRSPIVHRIRACAWAQLGEYRLARRSSREALRLSRAWRVPRSFQNDALDRLARREAVNDPIAFPATITEWESQLGGAGDYELIGTALSTSSVPVGSLLEDFLIDGFQERSPHGASGWRLLRARHLLSRGNDEATAARVAILLQPVLADDPASADARLLRAVALARLRDHHRAADDLLRAVEGSPTRATQALRIAIDCRRSGHWDDSRGFVEMWVQVTSTEATRRLGVDADRRAVIDRLLVLAEYAERNDDVSLAEATYRRLLIVDPALHVAANNLAVILSNRPAHLSEARMLAERAVAAAPNNTAYRDTLADLPNEP